MAQPTFFTKPPATALADIATLTKALLVDPTRGDHVITGLASLDEAGPMHLAFFDNLKYADQLKATRAGACLVSPRFEAQVPAHVAVLRAAQPFRAFVRIAREWHGDALRPQSWVGNDGIAPSTIIDPTARLEDGVIVDPLAVIGADVEIGSGTVVGVGAVIGPGVKIGRDCNVGARTAIQCALIGNDVLIHPGCSIGQDGYGFIFFGPEGHLKVPQTGRVLIQNNVEVGAGTTIDRGSLRDTVIGEGTKIDNQVQIGHNVTIGRNCLLAAQIGLAGSLTIGDNVALGAKVGINNHLKIGDGAQVTAMSGVKDDIPPNGRWGWFFRQADQAVVQGNYRGGAPGTRQQGRSEGRGTGMTEGSPIKFELVDINAILQTLPHRFPMLLIDRVINIRADYSGIGIKNVTFNEPAFQGHFPERPVYPGVMMIEAMAQTAGVIGIKSVEGTEKPRAVYFLTIDKCKFRKPVLPGDTIEYHMRSLGRRKTMWWFHGDAKVNGQVVAEADVGAMLTD
ncbi:UDP-3-O-[3-hydroxymyristoyl] glucosamine N-acyltransferase LpxD/beta-hydroxyacyl-ACP dehydratase FabZ [Bradyrhizobium diazoefficiens]